MSDEYEYGPWIEIPASGFLQTRGASLVRKEHLDAAEYRIATPKPKRALAVGKWYRHVEGCGSAFCQCIFAEGKGGYFRDEEGDPEAIWWSLHEIDWSTPPRDEAPE